MKDSLGFDIHATHDHAGRPLPRYVELVGGRHPNAPLPNFRHSTEIRRCHVRSWLDPEYSRILARRYGDRLIERFKGKRGLFLTLTYDRTPYSDPRDLYRTQSEDRHLRHFIRRLGKYLGVSLTGKWAAKMEFQRGGWLHWHVVVETPQFIDASDWPMLWPHGHAKAQRLNRVRARYFCKYFAKSGEDTPAFLYFERPRSVTIMRSSPGFWGDSDPEPVDASHCELTRPPDDFVEPPDSEPPPALPSLSGPRHQCPCFVPLGQRLTDATGRITVIARHGASRCYRVVRACINTVLVVSTLHGCSVRRCGRRYFIHGQIPPAAFESGEAAKRPAALDLIEGQKPRNQFRSLTWVQLALTQLGVLRWA